MSKIEKLIEKMYNNPIPSDISIDDIKKVASFFDCIVTTRGNHQWALICKNKGVVIPLPDHGKYIKKPYIKEIRGLFTEIKEDRK